MDFANGFFYSANQYYMEKFNCKVYKISLDAGCTCPNRDGTKGFGGCIFCSASGSGEFASLKNLSIKEQVEQAKLKVSQKLKKGKRVLYIAYFQNFTSTYGSEEELLKKYNDALECKDVVGLSLGTRPDCISQKMLDSLLEISKEKYVSIELGFQTSKNESVKYIRRMYENQVFTDCVKRIKQKAPDIHIVAHIILGLPNETKEEMQESVKYALQAGIDGIKFTVLYVVKNTDLAKDYEKHFFECLSKDEYIKILSSVICMLPKNIVVHRITGDGAKKDLIAPLWTENKREVLNSINRYFKENNILQGKLVM